MNALPGCEPQRRFEELVFRWLPLAGMLAASVAAFVFGPGWSARAAAVPWLISLVFVGLPHGAADLAIAQRLGSRTAAARMFIGYLAVMAAVFVGFAVFPVPLVLLFATLSIWHFGMSHADGQSPSIPAAFWPRLRAAVARGAGVLGVPLACWPAETSAVAARLLSVMGGNAAAGSFAPAGVRATGIALVAIAAVVGGAAWFMTQQQPATLASAPTSASADGAPAPQTSPAGATCLDGSTPAQGVCTKGNRPNRPAPVLGAGSAETLSRRLVGHWNWDGLPCADGPNVTIESGKLVFTARDSRFVHSVESETAQQVLTRVLEPSFALGEQYALTP